MPTTILDKSFTKNLYIVTEGYIDAQILRTLLICDSYINVYSVLSKGFNNIPSVSRTIELDMDLYDKMIIIFDADSNDRETIDNKISTIKFLTNWESYKKRIGIFCMIPNIENYLDIRWKPNKDINDIRQFISNNLKKLREKEIIREIQNFINAE